MRARELLATHSVATAKRPGSLEGAARRVGERRGPTWPSLALALLIVVSAALGWHLRWILDDAYISFRYAWNLVHGHGLVFNPGETPPVEGYTNFLWTLAMAVPIALGLDPTRPSLIAALASGLLTLGVTAGLARRVLGSAPLALVAVSLLGLNWTFLLFLTSGLETMFQTLLVTTGFALAFHASERGPSTRTALLLSLVGAAAILTRLDSAIVGGVTLVWLCLHSRGALLSTPARGRLLVLLLVPAALLIGVWVAWKLSYYGELLPNTWYAKEYGLDRGLRWDRGRRYLAAFATAYWLWPFAALAFLWPRAWRRPGHDLLACGVLAWSAYVVHVGADYMEYRFMVPILPALMIVLVGSAATLHRGAVLLLATALLTGSALRGIANDGTPIGHGRLPPAELGPIHTPDTNRWAALRRLVEAIPGHEELVWTLPAMGQSGYYTRFEVVDIHGLTDRAVARSPAAPLSPGHDKWATLDYLRSEGVHFAETTGDACLFRRLYRAGVDQDPLVRIGPVALKEGYAAYFLVLYLNPHPAAERLIEQHGARFAMPSLETCERIQAERRGRRSEADQATSERFVRGVARCVRDPARAAQSQERPSESEIASAASTSCARRPG